MRKLLILAVTAALLIGACGGDDASENPQGSLTDAVEALGDYEGFTLSMSIDSTAESLAALSEGAVTDEQAQQILDSSFTISSLSADDPADAQFEMAVNIAGEDNSVEMKFLENTLYLRADVAGIMETFGQDPAQLDAFVAQAGGQPGFEFVEPAINGEWIAMTGFDQLLQQAGSSQNQLTDAQRQAIEGFTTALEDSSDIEPGDKEGPGDNLVATIQLRELYQSLMDLQANLGAAAGEMPPVDEVPDEEVSIDTWVDDGRLTQIQLDLTQFRDFPDAQFPEGVDELALTVGLEEFTGGVEAPDGATEVDINQIMQGLMGGLGGLGGGTSPPGTGGGGGGGGDELCDQLEQQLQGQPQEVVDQFVQIYGQQCPGLGE
jgi:hypothetical protein